MYYFIFGYIVKVVGIEVGIDELVKIFFVCFGVLFMLLYFIEYVCMLGECMEKYGVNVWLINIGWIGGFYGVGNCIKLKYI